MDKEARYFSRNVGLPESLRARHTAYGDAPNNVQQISKYKIMVRNHGHGHINHLIIISYHIISCHVIMVIVISLKTLACTERCVYEKKEKKKLKIKNMRRRLEHEERLEGKQDLRTLIRCVSVLCVLVCGAIRLCDRFVNDSDWRSCKIEAFSAVN